MKIEFDSQGNLIKPTKIYAVVGNRFGFNEAFVHAILAKEIPSGATIISGGAAGVDTYAKTYAKLNGHPFVEYLPDFSKGSPACYFNRNEKIAKACNILIAFDSTGLRSGTGNTVRYANRLNKVIIIETECDCHGSNKG